MKNPLTFAPRPTLLALALLSLIASAPAWAGNACELVDGDLGTENVSGSSAIGAFAMSCGNGNGAAGQEAASVGGVGHYRNQQALSVGYSRLVTPRASVRIGAAFADGDNAAGVGFNVGW